MRRAIQLIENCSSEPDAEAMSRWLEANAGYLGGRILLPSGIDPHWRVQAFFQDDEDWATVSRSGEGWLPDGLRRVLIPDGLANVLGIRSSETVTERIEREERSKQ